MSGHVTVRVDPVTAENLRKFATVLNDMATQLDGKQSDTVLLDALREESWDLRCFPVPTGGDDADIGWRVIGHWMAEPCERVIGEVYHDDPRAAISAALQSGSEVGGE